MSHLPRQISPSATPAANGRWRLAFVRLLLIGASASASTSVANAGTWTQMTNPPLSSGSNLALLTDGRILVGNDGGNVWFILTPDSAGKYESATWTPLGVVASSHVNRMFAPSTMLNDGRYLIAGGEYVSGTDHATVDIFNPVLNAWTAGPDMPKPIADTAASILDDGTFLVSSFTYPQVYLYNPVTSTWTQKADIGTGGDGDEKGWTLLQNGKVIDIFDTLSIFTPSTNTWSRPVAPPISLIAAPPNAGNEIGAMSLLHSGKVLQFGASPPGTPGHTAIFDPNTSTWTVGPDAPDGFQFGDSPAAVMANGHVLCVSSRDIGGAPSSYWEVDPLSSPPRFVPVTFPPVNPQNVLFLNLPTGQILVASAHMLAPFLLYAPSGTPSASWRPSITAVSPPSAGEFTLTGTKLNGLTTGSTFGDDNNMGTNYPIVSLVSGTRTYYARSYGFNHMAPGLATSLKFVLPPSTVNGTYSVHVTASGVDSSNTATLTVSGTHVTQLSGGVTTLAPGATSTWTVSLSNAAPTGGTTVTLTSSDNRVATVPTSVVVPAGFTSKQFTLTGRGFGQAIISAQTPNAQFQAATRFYGWTVSSATAAGLDSTRPDAPFLVQVSISAPATTGGVAVNLSGNLSSVGVPATVTVPAGSTQTTFNVSAALNPSVAVVTASLFNSYQATGLSTDSRWSWLATQWN